MPFPHLSACLTPLHPANVSSSVTSSKKPPLTSLTWSAIQDLSLEAWVLDIVVLVLV